MHREAGRRWGRAREGGEDGRTREERAFVFRASTTAFAQAARRAGVQLLEGARRPACARTSDCPRCEGGSSNSLRVRSPRFHELAASHEDGSSQGADYTRGARPALLCAPPRDVRGRLGPSLLARRAVRAWGGNSQPDGARHGFRSCWSYVVMGGCGSQGSPDTERWLTCKARDNRLSR